MCPHLSLVIVETGSWITTHQRDPDEGWIHHNEPGSYYPTIRVICNDCGLNRQYGRSNRPKWLKVWLRELMIDF